jgi:hypothetical protein
MTPGCIGVATAPQINARRRLGRCYELAGRGIIECAAESGWTLVHGRARVSRSSPLIGGHAWCENLDCGIAYDAVANRFYRLENYYRLWKAKPVLRFTPKQAAIKLSKEGHWGPWEKLK